MNRSGEALALSCLLCFLAFATPTAAQPSFVEVSPTLDPYFVNPAGEDFWVNAVAPADVDGDGDVDLSMLGFYVVTDQSLDYVLILFLNQGPDGLGNWTFTHQSVPLGTMSTGASDIAWGDLDGDGDHDLVVGSDGTTLLFRNDGGTLIAMTAVLPGYFEDSDYSGAYDLRSATWADADDDGDLDLLLPSVRHPVTLVDRTALMRNDGPDGGGGWLFTDLEAALDATVHAQSAWADDDGDGDLDLLLVNVDPLDGNGFVKRFTNQAGIFSGSDLLDLRVQHGVADWADYDADGDLDLLVAGRIQSIDDSFATVLRVYENQGGVYFETTVATAPTAAWNDIQAASWADYDSDGDVDLLASGNRLVAAELVGRSKIFTNDAGIFTELALELPAPVDSLGEGGAFAWFDLDGDRDLDYFIAGAFYVTGNTGPVRAEMHLFRNDAPATNTAPGAPTNLVASPAGAGVTLAWDPTTDGETPLLQLTYDLQVRGAGGPPDAEPLRLPEAGGRSATPSATLANLAAGSYVWEVRAVDAAFVGGPEASGTFTIEGPGPIFVDGFESGNTIPWSGTVS